MYDEILFHGTELKRGERMIRCKRMYNSRGDRHWLGDGIYFYEDDFYAYKWIKHMYETRHWKDTYPPSNIFSEYEIIKANVKADKERIFDLDKPRYKIQFDIVHKNCLDKKKYSKRFSDVEMSEGVVLNIMFNEMDYSVDYDIVIATFKNKNSKYHKLPLRLDFMPEKQICVKKLDKAEPIGFYECKAKIPDFEFYINNLYDTNDSRIARTSSKVTTYNKTRNNKRRYRQK